MLGVLSRVSEEKPFPQALVLAPTRELAVQLVGVAYRIGKFTNIKIATAVREQDGAARCAVGLGAATVSMAC